MAQLVEHVFNILPPSQYDGTKTNIRRPREIAYFSYDDKRQCLPLSHASLKYYYPPFFAAPQDPSEQESLSDGFDDFTKHDDCINEHLDALLDTMKAYEEREGNAIEVDVVTWRGMMTKIMTTLYDRFDGFEMNATFFEGTIFIEEHKSGKDQGRTWSSRPGQPSQELMQYWGYKFEQLCTLPKPQPDCTREEIETRSQATVNNIEQYCSIVRTAIGDTSLLIAGEVDAVLGQKPEDPEEPIPWVELKTTKAIESEKDARKYEDKLLKYWAQSFLLAVPNIIVGFRSEHGLLVDIKQMDTQKIAKMQKVIAQERNRQTWDGNVCINFTSAFLQFLKTHINASGTFWRIQRRAKENTIRLFPIDMDVSTIVRQDFIEHRETMIRAAVSESAAA